MTYEEIIKALAERYNALSALDDDGSLAIEVDDTPVSFRKANGAVAVVARVCEMPEDAQGRVASLLLKASALMAAAGSGAFTLDESAREVSIACTLPVVRIDVDALSKTVEWLVDACHEWPATTRTRSTSASDIREVAHGRMPRTIASGVCENLVRFCCLVRLSNRNTAKP